MKRFILIFSTLLFVCSTAYGWGRREHAVVAKIAEDHLTPKAKELLHKYMHRRSIVYYSCYADDYQPLYIDLGWQPSNYRRMAMFPHTYCVDDNYQPPRSNRDGDKYIKNCLYYIDSWAKELKASHKKMNDSVRLTHLALIVHAVGDMHCPVHIRYPNDATLGVYKVKYGKKTMDFHRLWDAGLVGGVSPWSYTDLARAIDTATESDIAEWCKGDVFAWGEDAARIAKPLRCYKANDIIDSAKFKRENLEIGELLLCKAGYRLAKVLNEIFE
jgi:hypothetical protein